MINIALYSDGAFESCGVPNYFLKDEDLKTLIEDEQCRDDFIAEYGEGACVGVLGRETPDGYVEDDEFCLPDDAMRKGDLGFYEQL